MIGFKSHSNSIPPRQVKVLFWSFLACTSNISGTSSKAISLVVVMISIDFMESTSTSALSVTPDSMARMTAACLLFDRETAVTTAREEHSVSVDSESMIKVTEATSDLEEDHL